MIVAIDGPAGSGKSTVARAVAAVLGFTYLDSGAMYRCVALASLEAAGASAAELAAALEVSLGERVLLDGRDVTHEIRSPTVSAQASVVAKRGDIGERAHRAKVRLLHDHPEHQADGQPTPGQIHRRSRCDLLMHSRHQHALTSSSSTLSPQPQIMLFLTGLTLGGRSSARSVRALAPVTLVAERVSDKRHAVSRRTISAFGINAD